MLNITNKTTRADLILEIEMQRIELHRIPQHHAEELASVKAEHAAAVAALEVQHGKALDAALERVDDLDTDLLGARKDKAHAERLVSLLETDRDNLLGTIRVLSDPSRPIRIRASTIKAADIAHALPQHNTDKL